MTIRPVDVARKLGISTTTLRKYEEFGLTPPVPRTTSGYRYYTHEHIAYLNCARDMLPAFTTKGIADIFKFVMVKKIDEALWIANKAQANLHGEKMTTVKMIKNLLNKNDTVHNEVSKHLTINNISRETGVPVTTIRYWEKIGLISTERSTGNYRIFTAEHIKQVLAISALKYSVYTHRQKHSIKRIREELRSFDYNDSGRIAMTISDINQYLDQANRRQIKAIFSLYRLCIQVETGHYEG